jgi:Na+-transporting NADH:ubiquinone oxidoreductase subunit NqrC
MPSTVIFLVIITVRITVKLPEILMLFNIQEQKILTTKDVEVAVVKQNVQKVQVNKIGVPIEGIGLESCVYTRIYIMIYFFILYADH